MDVLDSAHMEQVANFEVASFSRALTALLGARKADDALPESLLILKMGENQSNQGVFIVDDETLTNLSAVQHELGRDRIPIGFEHNIDPGSEEYQRTTEPRLVAAKGATVKGTAGQGINLSAIAWTPDGAEKLPHYEDLSPSVIFDKVTRRVIGILSVSLTRTGSVYGLTLDSAAQARLSAVFKTSPHPPSLSQRESEEKKIMNPNDTLSVAELAAALKLPAAAGKTEVLAGLARLSAPVISTVKIKIGDKEEEFDMAGLASRLVTLETGYAQDRSRNGLAEKGALIARLSAAGQAPINPDTSKPYSADELGKLETPTLRLLVVNTPATVPLAQRARLSADPSGAAVADPNLKGTARVIAAFETENARRQAA
jgi:hypothetical protein